MAESAPIISRSRVAPILASVAGFVVLFLFAMWLRVVPLEPDPVLQGYLQVTTGLLAFVFAAVTLVRFQGTQDRISLILGAGFLLSGTILTASSLLFFQFQKGTQAQLHWAPVSWWVSRIVLALLFVVALLVEHFLPQSRHPRREIAGALLTVMASTYLITAALRRLPTEVSPHPGAVVPSPQQLLPAGIFLVAVIWYRRRLQLEDSAFDRTIYAAAWMNLGAQLAASQSQRLLDSPFVLAQALTVTSYAIALGGALLDNARLFEQVRHLAVSDPLTGLANYRRLLDVLEAETERTNRSGRPFAVLLLDLDGLKKINDTHGHLVGSHALNRLAHILRIHCRAIDTAARYGGDEFALVLPETLQEEAERVANRIRVVMASDSELPQLSASIGIAIYNGHGERIEKLLSDADAQLYFEKARRAKRYPTPLTNRRRAQKA
ncbi:MAG TPA: GGDEF domain-containing protein [Candidatus Acidoferrum sp.]|nr:GGDEF domain-containing protein [Candidatus Acidoferrum sp.]